VLSFSLNGGSTPLDAPSSSLGPFRNYISVFPSISRYLSFSLFCKRASTAHFTSQDLFLLNVFF